MPKFESKVCLLLMCLTRSVIGFVLDRPEAVKPIFHSPISTKVVGKGEQSLLYSQTHQEPHYLLLQSFWKLNANTFSLAPSSGSRKQRRLGLFP